MQLAHLALLWCPHCHTSLALSHGDAHHGTVTCENGHTFTITHGVLDLLGRARPASMAAWVNEFTLTAWLYERIWRPYALTRLSGQSFPYTRELPWLRDSVPSTCRTIVDIACSNGLYARALAQAYPHAQVIGIDRAMPMLIEAVTRAQQAQLPISYVRADARALPISTAKVDAVVVGGSWNEMEEIPVVLAEMARISAPNARLVAMALIQSSTPWGRRMQGILQYGGTQFFAPASLATRLHTAGWQLITTQSTGLVWQGVATRITHEE